MDNDAWRDRSCVQKVHEQCQLPVCSMVYGVKGRLCPRVHELGQSSAWSMVYGVEGHAVSRDCMKKASHPCSHWCTETQFLLVIEGSDVDVIRFHSN